MPVDAVGVPLPMYSYPAIEYLDQLDFARSRVLEFGSGQSTLWWAGRAAHVTSVEHDDWWVRRLADAGLANVTCLFAMRQHIATADGYIGVVPADQRFDVVALDGLHYYDCARAARRLLAPGGLVILDNADFYPATCALLRDDGFLEVDMAGFKPCHRDAQVTALFFDRDFSVPPRHGRQPVPCIGGTDRISPFDRPRGVRFKDGKPVIY